MNDEKVKQLKQDGLGFITKLELVQNEHYFKTAPFISNLELLFFDDEVELLRAANSNKIDSFALQSSSVLNLPRFNVHKLTMPRYFAIFFNHEKNKALAQLQVKKALNLATNKAEIIASLDNLAIIASSPLLPEFYGLKNSEVKYEFDPTQAQLLLEQAGFNQFDENGTRSKLAVTDVEFEFSKDLVKGSSGKEVKELQQCLAKDPEIYPEGTISGTFGAVTQAAVSKFQQKYAAEILTPQGLKAPSGDVKAATRDKLNQLCARKNTQELKLKFTLLTVDQPQLDQVARILQKQWKAIGVELEIKVSPVAELVQENLKIRDYEMILFGQVLGLIPDLYPFWHSKQKQDPGLNLALYENTQVDKLLSSAREAKDIETAANLNQQLQDIILQDAPAVFVYSPYYLYFTADKLKDFNIERIADPAKRFATISEWYINTKRVWPR